MARKRKKNNGNVRRLMGYSMTMGATGLIAGALPASAATPVQTVATTGSKFVAPMATVTGAGMVMGMIPKPKRRRRRK